MRQLPHTDRDLPLVGELDRVGDQMGQHLAQARSVCRNCRWHGGRVADICIRDVDHKFKVFLSGLRGGTVAGLFNQTAQAQRLHFQLKPAGLHF